MARRDARKFPSPREIRHQADATWCVALPSEASRFGAPSPRALAMAGLVGLVAVFLVAAKLAVPTGIAIAVGVGILGVPRSGPATRTYTGAITFCHVVTFGPHAAMAAMLRVIEQFPDQLVFPIVEDGEIHGLVSALEVLAEASHPVAARDLMHAPLVVDLYDRQSISALQRSRLPGAPIRDRDGHFIGIMHRGASASQVAWIARRGTT